MKAVLCNFRLKNVRETCFNLTKYTNVLFQITFEKNPVAETSKELVFLLPQRKIRCATTSLFGVGGSGRRPLESKKVRRSKRNQEQSDYEKL